MIRFETNKVKVSDSQIKILSILIQGPLLQKELREKLNVTSSTLVYHLKNLIKMGLVKKKTIEQIGNAKNNNISINSLQFQKIRSILGNISNKTTLITGFGFLDKGYKLPDISYNLLKDHYIIDDIMCFTTNQALEKRKYRVQIENLIKIKKYFVYDLEDYRNLNSIFFKEIDKILNKNLKKSDLIIDITPLSKLFSIKMLEIATRFSIPCIYIGKDEKNKNKLVWMNNIKIDRL